jgi:NAD(P)-dependent dehydrogenase (short-subunit alcohol dehydrogenase family)
MQTVLITGSSSGVGSAAALAFAKAGFQVIATLRNVEKGHVLKLKAQQEGLNIDIRQLDITDENSVTTAVNNILQDYKRIDVLINNAGTGYLGTLEQTSLAEAQSVMDVNFFGVWRLTQAVLPGMRQNKSGRIISITSVGGVIGQPFNDAYCAAKFAVEGFMESLAPVVKRFGIQVSVIEPGPINSEFVSSTLNNSPKLAAELEADYSAMFESYMAATKNTFAQLAQMPQEIAEVLLTAALANEPNFRYQTSETSKKIAALKLVDSTGNQVIALTGSRLPEIAN